MEQESKTAELKRIAVIIPTYNRAELLKEALQGTINQSYSPTEIVVVDNASKVPVKDALKEWLKDKKGITILRVEPNVNSAGAFYEGLKYSFQKGFDAYMFFDDDAEPTKDCIKNLMAHFSKDIGFVAPLVYDSVANEYQLFQNKFMSKGLLYDIPAVSDLEKIPNQLIKLDANATTGIIVNHKAVEKVGNFNRFLRVYGEDTDFTYRIARHFDSYLVPNALLIHKVQPADIKTQPLKNYYWVRNRLDLIKNYSEKRFVAKYILLTIWDDMKRFVQNRRAKLYLYRFAALCVGLFVNIKREEVHESLYRETPDISVTIDFQSLKDKS